jgi:hypothetical protein
MAYVIKVKGGGYLKENMIAGTYQVPTKAQATKFRSTGAAEYFAFSAGHLKASQYTLVVV